ncbi:LysE/ArgO family amino acid transporter [Cellulomonas sp. DKR-3]|uniref:LysE/ArgO family amino acid transporter n=1 Tax=Cellulomonas fulva TaxID=2835530 RepID=A0ABS5TYX6_9CELL|nr:LysE/ArgO family amino acid transporter [Cellulomonas fulva]MBT0994354.1 LysE/ArgO family amino acid transporter [Cellulomonas fulva]
MLPSLAAGFLACAGLIVAIGAQNAFVLRQGLRREHVLVVVVLCTGGDLVLTAAGIAGLGPLVAAHPVALDVTRWVGAAFLLVLAAAALRRARRPAALEPSTAPASRRGVVVTCLALTFLNPHVYLDTVVLLGSMAHQQPAAWAFGAGVVLASAAWFGTLGFGATRLRPLFARPRAWQVLDLVVAAVMAGLAVTLVVT